MSLFIQRVRAKAARDRKHVLHSVAREQDCLGPQQLVENLDVRNARMSFLEKQVFDRMIANHSLILLPHRRAGICVLVDDHSLRHIITIESSLNRCTNADFRGHTLTLKRQNDSAFSCPDTLGDKGLGAYIPAPHEIPAWWCNGSTSDSESLPPDSQTCNTLEVASITLAGCTTGCTNSPENEHGEAVGGSVLCSPDSALSSAVALPVKAGSFSAVLAMIAALPLSDAEKADAVRRLMGELAGSPEKNRGDA